MTGMVTSRKFLKTGYTAQHYREVTGKSTAKLYEFGKRVLTDSDDCASPQVPLNSLNTIKLEFEWGRQGESKPRVDFYAPPELGPIHEKAAKKGHSGAAKLGKEISISYVPNDTNFEICKEINPITFVFCYAPEDWLRARDIIPRSPEPELLDVKSGKKRERSGTPEIIDIDDLETDDDEIQIIKHLVPASASPNKRQRTIARTSASPKKEEDQGQ